jgi:predicted component of type VI protein secretion system
MTVVGRREDCDLRIPLSEVSRKHCRIIKDGDGVKLEDLGSSNGTFHNGNRVREATLAAGDTVQIGPVTFMVQIDGVPADEEMQPATGEAPALEPATDSAAGDFLGSDEAPATPAGAEAAAPATDDLNFDAVSEKDAGGSGSVQELDFDFDEEPAPNDRPA